MGDYTKRVKHPRFYCSLSRKLLEETLREQAKIKIVNENPNLGMHEIPSAEISPRFDLNDTRIGSWVMWVASKSRPHIFCIKSRYAQNAKKPEGVSSWIKDDLGEFDARKFFVSMPSEDEIENPPFRFANSDFALCTGRKRDATRLRERFLELYGDLIPLLEKDYMLGNFVTEREKFYNKLHTFSPYIPNFQKRGNGYREHFWVGFAWNKSEWKDPRKGIQYEFGIDKDGSIFYGIWVEGTSDARTTERNVYEVLVEEDPKLVLSTLRALGPEYHLWVNRAEDGQDIINSNVTEIGVDGVECFVQNLKSKCLWIHLGKKLTRKELCSIDNVPNDIIQTVHRLLPVYRWLSGLNGRPMTEKEAYRILKSGNVSLRKKIFSNQVGEREAYTSQRVGQNAVRRYTLEQYESKCALCDIAEPGLLVASHIVPWSEDPENRGNPRNVICMCVLHDRLFENGLLKIGGDYKVTFSKKFQMSCKNSVTMELIKQNTNQSLRLPTNDQPDPELLDKRVTKVRNIEGVNPSRAQEKMA
jgi:hypothetical protein